MSTNREQSTPIEVRVLGPLRLTVDGADVPVPGSRRRAVLALLATASPRPVSVDSLALAIWPEQVSGSGTVALQSHVSRLRRHLGPAASRLENGPGGYLLRLASDELDANHAADLTAQARRTGSADAQAGLALIREARRLWRGPPLEEFADVAALTPSRTSLNEQRVAAAELHAELALAVGEFQEAVEVAGHVVAEDGLRETSVLMLMRGLEGSGRAAEALRAARTHRRLLADEVGLHPSAALGALEYAIASAGGEAPHEPAAARDKRPMPLARSALIGRGSELAGISRLAQSECLVTLVGPSGVGKTRLALEIAHRDRSGRDVTMVSLAPVTDPTAVVGVVASALGLRGSIGDPLAAVTALLQARPTLVILDNCEHLLSPLRRLVTSLTDECTDLTVLATSTQRLGLPCEQVCVIAPLPLPAPDQREDLELIPAVAVFVQQAKRVRRDFQPSDAELSTIAGIVRRLDGLPLAIELAAGRLASISVGDLSVRLDRALDVLSSSTDPGDQRHSTLRAAITWSYDLLPPEHQRLFRALAVFADGFDLATGEGVADEVAPSTDPTTCVAQLVEASMLVASFEGAPRYRMLETIRAYGLDRLGVHHEREAATARLLGWVEQFVNWVDATVTTPDEPVANERLLAELGNVREAWQLARASDDLDLSATIVITLSWSSVTRDLTEISGWAVELAHDPRIERHPNAASVLAVASRATWSSAGDLVGAQVLAERAVTLVSDDETLPRLRCLDALAEVRLFQGRFDEAAALYVEVADGSPWRHFALASAGLATAYAGRLDEARALNEQASHASSPTDVAFHHYTAGEIDNRAGAWTTAQDHYRHALHLSRISGATFIHNVAAVGLVSVQAAAGEVPTALNGYRELIDHWERTGGWIQQWTTLRNLADLLDLLEDRSAAAFLRGAADANDRTNTNSPYSTDDATNGQIDAGGVAPVPRTRTEALDVARQSISRHLHDRTRTSGRGAAGATSASDGEPR